MEPKPVRIEIEYEDGSSLLLQTLHNTSLLSQFSTQTKEEGEK